MKNILASQDEENKPDGWEAVPYYGGFVFFDPKTTDETDVYELIEKVHNGDINALTEAIEQT